MPPPNAHRTNPDRSSVTSSATTSPAHIAAHAAAIVRIFILPPLVYLNSRSVPAKSTKSLSVAEPEPA